VVVRKPDSPASIAIKKLAADLIGERYIPPEPEKKPFMQKLLGGFFGRG